MSKLCRVFLDSVSKSEHEKNQAHFWTISLGAALRQYIAKQHISNLVLKVIEYEMKTLKILVEKCSVSRDT